MTFASRDRVKVRTATSGTGPLTLSGAEFGCQSFTDAGLDGFEVPYCIFDPVTGDWEVTEGTYTASGSSLTRAATPLASSNAGAKVNLAGNSETYVFLTDPALYQHLPKNFTAGSLYFAGTGGVLAQDNSNLFWDNSNKKLGIGTTSPDCKLHVHHGSAGTISAPAAAVATLESNANAFLSFLTPNNMAAGVIFGDPDDSNHAEFYFDHATDRFSYNVGGTVRSNLGTAGLSVGNGTTAATARIHSKVGTTDATPALKLDQGDVSEQFIDYVSTSAASVANPISTWKSGGQIQGFVRQSINGTHYWMPYYSAPSSANANFAEVSITAATTLTSTAFGKMHVISGTTADYTITLPAVSGNAGQMIHFRVAPVASANRWYTLDGNSSETINGATTRMLRALESCTLYCTGTEWIKTAGLTIPMACIMRRTTTQSIAYNTWTQIQTVIVVEDNTSSMAVPMADTTNGRAKALRPGRYQANGFASISGVTAGKEFNGGVAKNSGTPADDPNAFTTVSVPASTVAQATGTAGFTCAAGDWMAAVCFHDDSGGSKNTRAVSTVYPTLSVTEIPMW